MITRLEKRGRRQRFPRPLRILLMMAALGTIFCLSADPAPVFAADTYSASGQVFSLNTNWTSGDGGGSTAGGYSSTPIQLGNTADGTFTSSSPTHSDGTHYALYSIQAAGGQRIAVSMSSADFKPYLELWDTSNPATAQVLCKNSGVKGGAPAVLPASGDYYEIPASGTYYIFADTYSAGETGSYSLTITSPTLSGAEISFSRVGGGTAPGPVQTGSDGTWSQTGFEAGVTYSAIASYNGYAFTSQEFTADGNKTGINFNGMVPGIKVTAPASGQSVTAGNTLTITWSYIGNPGSAVNVEVLQGATVAATITDQPIGNGVTGSCIWTVPPGQSSGSDYTVRVTSASNSAYTATSSSFSVGVSSLTLTAPTVGESWAVGQTYNITWSYAGNSGATVGIELLKSDAVSATLATGVSIDQKTYAWNIAGTVAAGSDYKIRVTRSDTGASTTGDSTFSILPSTGFPVSGKVVEVLTDPSVISWHSADISIGDTIKNQSLSSSEHVYPLDHTWHVQKYRFNACRGQKIAINVTFNTVAISNTTVGAMLADYTCANFPPNNNTYNVSYRAGAGTVRWPASGYYEITDSATYTVCIGNFGATAADMNFDFTLEAPPVSGAAVKLSKISGSNETFSERTTTTGSDGAWSFSAVPPGSTYRIKPVLDKYIFNSQDISTTAAGVALRGCEDHLEITAPTSGTSWDPGTTQNIYWNFWGSHNPHLELELYKNDVWVADICQNTWGSNGGGYQDWAIPMGLEPGSGYTIKAKESGVVTATSGSFTINNISAGGRINLSSQSSYILKSGARVPNTGTLAAVALRIGSQITSSSYRMFYYSNMDLYTQQFTSLPGYTYKTDCGYYFYAKAGQVFHFSGAGYTGKDGSYAYTRAAFQFCVVAVQANGSYTIPGDQGNSAGLINFGFTFTAPSDGTYMAIPFANPSDTDPTASGAGIYCLYNFSADVGVPGVTVAVTQEGGTTSSSITTDGDGIWNLPDIDGDVTYRAVPSYSNWGFTPAYLDFTGSGSAYNFAANAPSISVSGPAAGVNWGLRTTQEVAWTYLGDPGEYVKIELLDSTGTAITITDAAVNIPTETGGSGGYDWLIPGDITPGAYTIKVSSTDGQYSAASSQFTISNPLSVTSPSSGANCLAGQTSTVGWSYGDSDIGSTVKIELLKAGTVVDGPLTTGSGINGIGTYSWSMPSDAGSDYQIRITSEAYPVITAASASFTVSGSYTASGHVTELYTGPESPLSSVGAAGGPVSVPIAFGQTVNGSFNSTDYKSGGYYFDCYQLALEKGRPVSFQAYQTGNPDIAVSLNAVVKAGVDYFIAGTFPDNSNIRYGYPSYPSSGSITFSDDVFYYNDTQYDEIDQLCVVSVWVISEITGPYTLTVQCPVSGAAVSFTTQSGIAAPPAAASTDENGLWSATFDSGSVYSASVKKDGYTAQTGPLTVDASSADLNFTVTPNAACPAITGMTLDSLEGPAGQVNTVNISIQTSGAADGTSIGAILLTDEMRDINTFQSYDDPAFAAGTVYGNTAVMTLTIPSAIPTGYYKIRAILGGTAETVTRPYQLTNTSAVPAISTVAVSPDHQCTGQLGTITITVTTSNVAAGTSVSAILTDGDGNPLSLSVAATSRLIANNQAVLTLNVPTTLAAGSYKARVTVNASTSLVVFKDYTITAINSVSEITSFSVSGQTGASVIDTTGQAITFHMPGGSNVTKLAPTITIDGARILPASGVLRNFTSPVTYTVTAADGTSSAWKVTCIVNSAPETGNDITSFSLPGQSGVASIDSANKVITVTFAASADLSKMKAAFTLSTGAAAAVNGVGQISGTTENNFRFPVTYTVTAEDGTSSTWTINVTSSTRQYAITGGSLDDVCKATVTVSPTSGPDHSGKEAIVFQLWKDDKAVRVICMTRDIQSAETLNASFNVAGSGYTVRVVVYDSWSSVKDGNQLADAVIL